MTNRKPTSRVNDAGVAPPEKLCVYRRRGSVLILVMTLLGVLFVTGIMFLATVNFEADLIESDRQRDRGRVGVQSVVDEIGTMLRDGLVGASGGPFVGEPVGDSKVAFAELPAFRSLISPIEPYPTSGGKIAFGWFTDLEYLTTGQHAQPYSLNPVYEIDTAWPSGAHFDTELPTYLLPVDADGDGITDTLQIDVQTLGFAEAQIEALSERLNGSSRASDRVYLGLRVIPHGGLVNLNESHPALVANVLGVTVDKLRTTNWPDPELGYFRYRPILLASDLEKLGKKKPLPEPTARFYSPLLEEPLLRRRLLLPPRVPMPSLLQGNPHLDADEKPYGDAELATRLYPPTLEGDYETVYEGMHRYVPFSPDELYIPGDLDSPPLWAARMEPFSSREADDSWSAYDRRHLVTTISYDDLLSRGGQVETVVDGNEAAKDIVERMREVNRAADIPGECPDQWNPPQPLPFEYADYPQHIVNGTMPNEGEEAVVCDCPTRDVCRFDPRKGRLKLSLAYLDKEFPCEELPVGTVEEQKIVAQCRVRRQRLIHDAFMLLVRNAQGPYWEDVDCTTLIGLCDEWNVETGDDWAGTCELTGERTCEGGSKDGKACTVPANCPGGSCMDRRACKDPVTWQSRRQSLLSRTAASLTANMLDYMDADDIPTRVVLRSFDFNQWRCWYSANQGTVCDPRKDNKDCPAGKCVPVAGWAFEGDTATSLFPEIPARFVYGLERQPYITEVATAANEDVTARAVEIFNPYDVDVVEDADGDGVTDYWLVEVGPGASPGGAPRIPLNHDLLAGEFTAFATGAAGDLGLTGPVRPAGRWYTATTNLGFGNGWTIYLVRRVTYPGDVTATEIVVDQFTVDDSKTGKPKPDDESLPYDPGPVRVYGMQRMVPDPSVPPLKSIWTAPVPDTSENQTDNTLGNWNTYTNPNIPPVEVNAANTGSFTKFRPEDDPILPQFGVAFPTTGSMLLLMRHANRSLDDFRQPRYLSAVRVDTADLAFTTWLDDTIQWREEDPNRVGGLSATFSSVNEMQQVDNGRMPVFDVGELVFADDPRFGRWYLHHADPAYGACCVSQGGNDVCFQARYAQCRADPNFVSHVLGATCDTNACPSPDEWKYRPGGLANLPWGQLVFDYFTALPLRSLGPYEDPDPEGNPEFEPGKPDSLPRVDQDGLRVHGRININAAPWKVLSGVPMVPMQKIARAFRAKTRWGAGLVAPWVPEDHRLNPDPDAGELYVFDDDAGPIGNSIAQAVVAYRELRWIDDVDGSGNTVTTGNYGDHQYGHGWSTDIYGAPVARRGPGFLSVGELAAVRHPGATTYPDGNGMPFYSYHQIDLAALMRPNRDYVEAVGLMVALSDWVTTRSQVFTVYGTLRGEPDEQIVDPKNPQRQAELRAADVDTRAIRFQETVDRLPTFAGESVPVRVGQRAVSPYIDARGD